jgi:hypothetical protein
LQGVTITADQCFFASAVQTDGWLTTINCVANYKGTILDLCLPAIGACSQLQICTTAQFLMTKRFESSQRITTSNRFVLASLEGNPSSETESRVFLGSDEVISRSIVLSFIVFTSPEIIPTFAILFPLDIVLDLTYS